jgi:hypothetical protein
MRGTVKMLGLEGGVWALVTDDGQTIELIDPPAGLCQNGKRVEVVADDKRKPDVTVGMVGDAVRVKSFKIL